MKSVFALTFKDLRLLWRDRFGLFWVVAFPLLMALFFGSIFSGSSGGARMMRVGLVNDNASVAAKGFYEALAASSAIEPRFLSLDSARHQVSRGVLTAYVYYRDTSLSIASMFGGPGKTAIEVGVDPSRQAEKGYLQGLVSQAFYTQVQKQMMDPGSWMGPLDERLRAVDTIGGLSTSQRAMLTGFMTNLTGFLSSVDSSDSAAARMAEAAPGATLEIEFADVASERLYPRSSWEITFPQSLQWALIGVAAAFALSIVTERTRGTYLRLRLAPLGHAHILAGKGLACFITAVLVCSCLLAFGIAVFGVRVTSTIHLALAVVLSAFCFVGIMMFISVLGKSEQAVSGAGWAILLVMSMTGGGMVPLFMMPGWMSTLGSISAVRWSVYALEGAIWRGLTFGEMLRPLGILAGYGVVFFLAGMLLMRRIRES